MRRPSRTRPAGARRPRRGSTGLAPAAAALRRVAADLAARDAEGLMVAWSTAVGPALARRSRPLVLEKATLVVGVDDPAWQRELEGMTRRILPRLREVLGAGAPTRLLFRPSPRPADGDPGPSA